MDLTLFRKLPITARLRSLSTLNLHEFVNFCVICEMNELLPTKLGKSLLRQITWIDRPMCNFLLNKFPHISYENMVPAMKYYANRILQLGSPPSESHLDEINVLIYEPLSGKAAKQFPFACKMMGNFTRNITRLTDEINADITCPKINSRIDITITIPKLHEPIDMITMERNMKIAKEVNRIPTMDVIIYCVDENLSDTEHLELIIELLTREQLLILAIFCNGGTKNTLQVLGEFNKKLRSLNTYSETNRWILWCIKCETSNNTILNFDELKYFLFDCKRK